MANVASETEYRREHLRLLGQIKLILAVILFWVAISAGLYIGDFLGQRFAQGFGI